MRHWITAHNAHPHPDTLAWNLYLKHPLPDDLTPETRDLVLFYECESPADGANRRGDRALVRAGEVGGPMRKRSPVLSPWVYEFPCTKIRRGKNVPFAQVVNVIPWFRRPGGVKFLAPEEYRRLAQRMGV